MYSHPVPNGPPVCQSVNLQRRRLLEVGKDFPTDECSRGMDCGSLAEV